MHAEVTKSGRVKEDVYATSEDILLRLIQPKLYKINNDKYGKQTTLLIAITNCNAFKRLFGVANIILSFCFKIFVTGVCSKIVPPRSSTAFAKPNS